MCPFANVVAYEYHEHRQYFQVEILLFTHAPRKQETDIAKLNDTADLVM